MTDLSVRDHAQWYLIYTKPRQEERARCNLVRQGYHVYVPEVKTLKHRQGKWCPVTEPLFPNYVFIKLSEIDENWMPIRSTFGVSNLVRFGETPATISPDIVSIIRDKSSSCTITEERIFSPGQKLRVVFGAMQGLEAVFHCMSGTERAYIFLEFLGQITKIKIDLDAIVPAHA